MVRTAHGNAFTSSSKAPGSKLPGKWMRLTEDYPFTGFLQIWRSVSCVIACVPSIRAALIFFLFAVLIIFISRRFPWLLGGFLKWSTIKLKNKSWASITERLFWSVCGMLSDHVVPCSRGGYVGWKVFFRWHSWSERSKRRNSVFKISWQHNWL